MVNESRLTDMSHLLPAPVVTRQQIIYPYKNAHAQYVALQEVLEPIQTPIFEAYRYAVQECPELAQYKMYNDCTDFVLKELRYATGNRLRALVIWMTLVEEFWERLGTAGSCPEYVVTWRMIWAQSLRYQLIETYNTSKPWRRKGSKLKQAKLGSSDINASIAFH